VKVTIPANANVSEHGRKFQDYQSRGQALGAGSIWPAIIYRGMTKRTPLPFLGAVTPVKVSGNIF
jgi:hypothetical protein